MALKLMSFEEKNNDDDKNVGAVIGFNKVDYLLNKEVNILVQSQTIKKKSDILY